MRNDTADLEDAELSSQLALLLGELRRAIEDQLRKTETWRGAVRSSKNPRARRPGKRDPRAATIKALEKALVDHIRAARSHAYATIESEGYPVLLPRPTQKELAAQIKRSKYAVSRALADKDAKILTRLWQIANDLDAVMDYGRR